MKKFFALFLVLATLLSVLVACADGADGQTDPSVNEQTNDPTQLDHLPNDLKFNQDDINILSRAFVGWTWDEVAVPELNTEPVNDAIFNRNMIVSDRLGVNIVSHAIEDPDQFKPIEEIKRVVKAGSDEYDLVAAAAYVAAPAALDGTFIDLAELEYLDLSQEYWMQDYNLAMSYQDMQHTATGMIALSTYRFAFVTMFNKNEFDDRSVPYLYEAVTNNEWTLEYQAVLAEQFYHDVNGSGTRDEGDFFGFISCAGINTDPYWASCDLPIVEKNPDGDYTFVLDVERYAEAMDRILFLFYECSGTYLYESKTNNEEQDDIRQAFARGEGAMTTLRLVAVEQPDVRNMEQQYGIVPMPKYDAAQADYGTLMHDQFTVFSIPVSAANDKMEMIGAVMEAMASESMRSVKPAYYEIALKRKYMSDPVAWDMLDTVFDVVRIDPAVVYTDAIGNPHHTLRVIVKSENNTVASQCRKMDKSVERYLRTLQNKMDALAQ